MSMANLPSVNSSSSPRFTFWITIGSIVMVVVGLYFVFPYTFGYGLEKISLASMCYQLWHAYGDWEHGMMVLPIVIWLSWRLRKELAALPICGAHSGLAITMFALFCFWIGYRTDIQYVGFVSAQILISGLIIWFLGWQQMRKLLFPWLFLTFMWPFLFLDSIIAFPLRMVMAEMSYHFLNLIGLDTIRVGSAIVSAPDAAQGLAAGARFEVDIADPCSGIRSLFALTMVSSLYGHLTMQKGWQVTALFLSAFPLAILGNFVRIMLLTFGVLAFGTDFAIGTLENPSAYHMAAGFVVFAVALLGMVAVADLLRRIGGWMERKVLKTNTHATEAPATTERTNFDY